MKIHIETGNSYYKNNDTNESIFEFMKNQQSSSKGIIKSGLVYDRSYNDYFKWILNGFDTYEKTKYDLLTFKNTKYLLHHFNDFQESIGQLLIKVRHSIVTDNYIVAEEIQNQNWQYFIECVIEVCKSKEIGSTIKQSEDFLLTMVENVTIAKKSYETFYNVIEKNFYSTMSNISTDEHEILTKDFLGENFWGENSTVELGVWLAFSFKHARFLGSQKLISIPRVNLPIFLKIDIPISSVEL